MKLFVLTLIAFFFFLSCSPSEDKSISQELENVDSLVEADAELFSSIRKGGKLIAGEIYTDTLVFILYNDNADYAFAEFLTKENDTVALVLNDFIEPCSFERKFACKWKMDSLYEAGEGDELYFQERLVEFEIVRETEDSFELFLQSFVPQFIESAFNLENHIFEEIGFYNSINPGVYCVLEKINSVTKPISFSSDYIVSANTLNGDFCEGYSGAENGFYYQRIINENLPTFYTLKEDGIMEEKYEIPESFLKNELMQVTIVNEEYHRAHLYFIQVKNKWYFFAQNYCDCSA